MEQRSVAVEAVFEPVSPPTTFEETVERLGKAIRLGLLAPGSRLPPERELAAQLGISRSTLRQALTTLVQTGHLLSVRGRSGGTFVADEPPLASSDVRRPSPARMRAILDYRVAVETGAALLAAERGRPKDLDRLRGCVDKMASAQRFDTYRRADMRFHIAVAESAQSPRLVAAMTEVQADMGQLIALIPHPDTVLTRSNAQHGRLVRALERGDASRAVRIAREHLTGTEHILAGLMAAPGPRRRR
ncbi:MAG TPA: FCD domain-containing protein [Solirubrobacteraceae bacterium]|nr:FCD domain-containing protein [Solirubrobacteraceae bacterium]